MFVETHDSEYICNMHPNLRIFVNLQIHQEKMNQDLVFKGLICLKLYAGRIQHGFKHN